MVDHSTCHCEKLGCMCAKCYREWQQAGYPSRPRTTDRAGKYRSDGHGCVERVHPTELAMEERY